MPIDVAAITRARQQARDSVKNTGPEAATNLELQYIADSLEAIRGELAGFAHLLGVMATRPSR
jgi:hypothetical protein